MDDSDSVVVWGRHTDLERVEVQIEEGGLQLPVAIRVQRIVDAGDDMDAEDKEPPDCKHPERKANNLS